jgi:ferredoxin
MMADLDERVIGDITLRRDRSVCVGFGHCVDEAPGAFLIDDENIVSFAQPERVDRARLLEACEACPVGALIVMSESGEQLVP